MEREAKLAKARVGAYARVSSEKVELAAKLSDKATKEKLRMVVKPPKISSAMKKTGAALILTPDPLTAVPGVALLGASVAMKSRDAASLEDLAKETRKAMRELGSIL